MGKALEARLDGHLEEFLSDCQALSIWDALEKWHLPETGSAYLRARKIGMEVTKDENFGMGARASSYVRQGFRGVIRELVGAFAEYVIAMDRQNEELKKQRDAHAIDNHKLEREFATNAGDFTEYLRSKTPGRL